VQRNDPAPAADVASVSQGGDRPLIGVALDEAAKRLHVLDEWDAADAVLRDARHALSLVGAASRALDAWKSPAEVVKAQLRQSARSVYLEPESAVRELLDHSRDERTLEEAKEWLRTWPEYFGKLEPDTATGLARLRPWSSFGTARRNARGLVDRLDAAARHEWKRPKPEAYTRAAEEVEKAKAAVDAASAARDAVSKLSRKPLMERVTLALEPLRAAMGHEEIERRLGHKLTPETVYLLREALTARQAVKAAINLAEGPQPGGNELEF
jgi:hypothetical protein